MRYVYIMVHKYKIGAIRSIKAIMNGTPFDCTTLMGMMFLYSLHSV